MSSTVCLPGPRSASREDGALGLVRRTSPGDVVLDRVTATGRERVYVVRVGSTVSEIGGYGGGDYTLSLELER